MTACTENTLIQTMVDEDKRGRVMSFFGMAFQGAAPFGSLLAGWLAGIVGVRAVVTGSGALVLVGGWCSPRNSRDCGDTHDPCTPGSVSCRRPRPG
ncbi:MFS transporter [Gemmata sp. G18]|uniref:MFS transporter n=1 Tax=Gemmata palustris TaxID=2822762 RepID=A0ABS5BVQ4_9BACT|nr:MFS transporter [Gemmata palustris]MBP3957802.1 MFS transporter [Gemmata palustris]